MSARILGFGLLSVLLVGTGCDDDGHGGHDGGTTLLDGGDGGGDAPTDTPTTDVPTDVPADTGPGTCPSGACDLLTNGCAATEACYLLSATAGANPAPMCQPAGVGGNGDTCASYLDCSSGYFCLGSETKCRHYCCAGSDNGCPTDTKCSVQLTNPDGSPTGAGYCQACATCDPVAQTGCGTDEGCYLNDMEGCRICIESLSDRAEGETCGPANDCAAGMGCFGTGGANSCHKFCDTTATPTTCTGGRSCVSLSITGELANLGVCVASTSADAGTD